MAKTRFWSAAELQTIQTCEVARFRSALSPYSQNYTWRHSVQSSRSTCPEQTPRKL